MKISFHVIALLLFSFLLIFSNCKSDKGGQKTDEKIVGKPSTKMAEKKSETTPTKKSETTPAKITLPDVLETGWYHVVDSSSAAVRIQLDRSDQFYHLDPTPALTIKHLQEAYLYSGMTNEEGVRMRLTEEGKSLWTKVTDKAKQKYMGFVIDNVLVVTQRIPGRDNGGETIFFKKEYSKAEMEAISEKLNERVKRSK